MSIEYTVSNYVATVTINRPEALNAIDLETRTQMRDLWLRIQHDDQVRVVVFTGAGHKAFCVGADLKKTMPPKESFAELTFGQAQSDHLLAGLIDLEKPVICAVNGYAMGGGLELALACDIRLASDNAQFALSESRIGSIPGAGGTQTLPRTIGTSNAMLMMLTGERITAERALQLGLISEVVAQEDLLQTAQAIATKIAQNAPLSVRAIKKLVYEGIDIPLRTAINYERQAFGLLRDTQDRIEGRLAFQEKRPPQYKGC